MWRRPVPWGHARRSEPWCDAEVYLLLGALVVVIVGSLLGEWAGFLLRLGRAWFWLGNQGWGYPSSAGFWQYCWRRPRRLVRLVVEAGGAGLARSEQAVRGRCSCSRPWRSRFLHFCALFRWEDPLHRRRYLAFLDHSSVGRRLLRALRHGGRPLIFCQLGLVDVAALRVIYLDVILIFGGGLIGTGHHWYFTGQTDFNMAISAIFSALEVVPLTLLTLDRGFRYGNARRGRKDVPAQMDFLFPDVGGLLEFREPACSAF